MGNFIRIAAVLALLLWLIRDTRLVLFLAAGLGATFVVLGPEHPLVQTLANRSPDGAALRQQVQTFRTQDRTARISGSSKSAKYRNGAEAPNSCP